VRQPRSLAVAAALAAALSGAALFLGAGQGLAETTRKKDWRSASAKVDDLIAAKWKSEKDLQVAPRTDDAEFLRRVTLDLTGVIPTEAETVEFLHDPSPDKRAALVDRLLLTPRHADWFATWYSNLLVGTKIRERNLNRRTFNEWMREQFSKNRPYDELVRDIVTAQGNSDENGSIGFVSSFERSAADAAGKTSRLFLGVQIQCAQCHDHPYDKRIKQEDFAGFAAFFMTTTHRRNQTQGDPNVSWDVWSHEKEEMTRGRLRGPAAPGGSMDRTGAPLVLDPAANPFTRGSVAEAQFLLGSKVKDTPGVTRRELLARWMTSPKNALFAHAFANRLWAYFLGHGIVHPVDDFHSHNKPTNPELLDFLAEEAVRGGFDVNHMVRVIVGTEAYQRSSKNPRGVERPAESLFATGPIKPLTVEQSFDSFYRATGAEGYLETRLREGLGKGPNMRRAGQNVDPKMLVYDLFRRTFDDDEGGETEEFTGTIPRGLMMMNGMQVNELVAAKSGRPLRTILDTEKSDRERIRRLYLTVLSREPSPGETSAARAHLDTSRNETQGYEDLLWALLNTTEFMSNH
jgi:hypothetical protein